MAVSHKQDREWFSHFFLSAPFDLLYLPSICHWLKDAPHFEHIKILSVQVVFKFSTNYSKMCQKMKKWSICEEWRCLTCCMSWTWLIYFESIVAITVYILLYSPEYPRCPTRRPSKCSDNVTGQYAVSRGGWEIYHAELEKYEQVCC